MTQGNILEAKAKDLILHVSKGCTTRYEGSWTMSIYDTAWVSVVENDDGTWAFPEAFAYILEHQEPGSGWPGHAAEIDGILNTLAGLLAIEKRISKPTRFTAVEIRELKHRRGDAVSFLQSALNNWDVEACVHVGFEMLVPALLSMLSDYGLDLEFPGKDVLRRLNGQKMKSFKADKLYGSHQTTVLHSLEAFVGLVDFSKLSHHLVGGSMLGSPSATAAYLMYSNGWDTEAEAYLRNCIKYGGGNGSGGVPSAYPCGTFEFTWVLTTLVHAGIPEKVLQSESLSAALDVLESRLRNGNGKVGFATGMLADSDDTSKAIHILNIMGRPTNIDNLIAHFLSPAGHMMTYLDERNPSPSASCNALLCMLDAEGVDLHLEAVREITSSLCNYWWDNKLGDKWNIPEDYTYMLLAQALVALLRRRNLGPLPGIPDSLIRHRALVVLVQLLNRYLFGSLSPDSGPTAPYQRYPESIGYEILACTALRSLPFPESIQSQLDKTITAKRASLSSSECLWKSDQYLWIEKVSYGSRILSDAYCVAALYISPSRCTWADDIKAWFQPTGYSVNLAAFFEKVHGKEIPTWSYKTCVLEGAMFAPRLHSSRVSIFPPRHGLKDKYINYIPVAWTLISNLRGLRISANTLWDMMHFSLLDFLVDEYMESTVALLGECERDMVREFITTNLALPCGVNGRLLSRKRGIAAVLDAVSVTETHDSGLNAEVELVKGTLMRYVTEIFGHLRVLSASRYDQQQVHREIHSFLLAHMTQMTDNTALTSDHSQERTGPKPKLVFNTSSPFFHWVRTTGSQHVSCPISFAFFCCLISASNGQNERDDCLPTPQQKYMASDLCVHLAAMSRLFNDYASIKRDQKEGNLNSVNFPEFHRADLSSTAKTSLLQLGEYERQASRSALLQLQDNIRMQNGGRRRLDCELVCRSMELFAYVTELFGDMYVARDLTNAAQ